MPEAKKEKLLVMGSDIPKTMLVINTAWAQVAIYGIDNVSKKDIKILEMCLARPEFALDQGDHCVRTVMFRSDNRPAGLQAICVPDSQGIVINLQAVFEKAVEEAMDDPLLSIRAAYHRNLILDYLHEIHHMVVLQSEGGIPKDEKAREELEKAAEEWALAELISMAKYQDIEPEWSSGDFFTRAVGGLMAEGGDWIEAQQRLMDNNIMYELPPTSPGKDDGMTFMSFKSIIRMMDEEKNWDDPAWDVRPGETRQPGDEPVASLPEEKLAPEAIIKVEPAPEKDDPFVSATSPHDNMADFPPADAEYDPNMMDFDDGMQMMAGMMSMGFGGEEAIFSDGTPPVTHTPSPAVAVPPAYIPPAVAGPEYVADQMTARPTVYPQTGLTPEQTRDVVFTVFNKIYHHIFSNCGRLLSSDLGFSNPEAVCTKPIMLSPQEQAVIVKADVLDENGRWCPGMSTANGLRGFIMKNTKLPAYKMYINNGGYEAIRLILPQNPAKRDGSGQYTKPALQARGGTSILYVMDGEDKLPGTTSSKFFFKCIDGRWEAC